MQSYKKNKTWTKYVTEIMMEFMKCEESYWKKENNLAH